jgi:hypothetical protein
VVQQARADEVVLARAATEAAVASPQVAVAVAVAAARSR